MPYNGGVLRGLIENDEVIRVSQNCCMNAGPSQPPLDSTPVTAPPPVNGDADNILVQSELSGRELTPVTACRVKLLTFDQQGDKASEACIEKISKLEQGLKIIKDRLAWIDIKVDRQDTAETILKKVRKYMPLDDDEVADCLRFDREAKIVEKPNHLFLTTHCLSSAADSRTKPVTHELHAFINKHLLVTVHADPIPALDACWKRVKDGKPSNGTGANVDKSPAGLFLRLARSFMRANEPVVGAIKAELNKIDPDAHTGKISEEVIHEELTPVIRSIAQMSTLASEQHERFLTLADIESTFVSDTVSEGFGKLAREAESFEEKVEKQGLHVDRLINACKLAISIKQNEIAIRQNEIALNQNEIALKQNEVMKTGAIFAAVITPQLLVVGFFGMNFPSIPFDKPGLLIGSMVGAAMVSAGIIAYGYTRGWLKKDKIPSRSPE